MAPPGLVSEESGEKRKKVVVVGLGMVGVAFIEKLIQKDKKRQEYEIIILGEEKYVAYNRVGLTSFFCISILVFSIDFKHIGPSRIYISTLSIGIPPTSPAFWDTISTHS